MKIDGETYRKMTKLNDKVVATGFTPKSWARGTLLPILTYTNSNVFRLISVNEEQGLMPVKYNGVFMNKQHPNNPFWIQLSLQFLELMATEASFRVQFLTSLQKFARRLTPLFVMPRNICFCIIHFFYIF